MTWYYAVGSQQQGPVTEDQLRGLIKDGVVTGDTRVWREGMTDWQLYRLVSGAPPEPPPAPLPGAATEHARTDYDSPLGDCFTRGIQSATKNLPASYMAVLPVCLIFFAVQMAQLAPFVGIVLPMVLGVALNAALIGGVWRYFLKQSRGEAVPGDVFGGFQRGYFDLTLGAIVRVLLSMVSLFPGLFVIGLAVGAGIASGNVVAAASGFLIGAPMIMAGSLVTIYLLTCWCFMLPLVSDKGLGFWEAMQTSRQVVRKHWWSNFVMLAVLTLITFVPIILVSTMFGPSLDFKDFKQLVEAFKQGRLTMPPGQVLMENGIGMLWLWLFSPFYYSVMAARYQDIFGKSTPQDR